MTYLLSFDAGLNTGIALMHYSPTEPVTLVARWQVHNGLDGFLDWAEREWHPGLADEVVVEKFVFDPSAKAADLAGVPIEGVIAVYARRDGAPIIWHTRADKSGLIGYPESAATKAQRQRVRFDFLERIGMFAAGTENDDSNDAIVHGLVSLKRRRHLPTIRAYFKRGD